MSVTLHAVLVAKEHAYRTLQTHPSFFQRSPAASSMRTMAL